MLLGWKRLEGVQNFLERHQGSVGTDDLEVRGECVRLDLEELRQVLEGLDAPLFDRLLRLVGLGSLVLLLGLGRLRLRFGVGRGLFLTFGTDFGTGLCGLGIFRVRASL
jgi:hypothetical protein